MPSPPIEIGLPAWTEPFRVPRQLDGDVARMDFVISLARENVRQRTGGPFAAAIFEIPTGTLVGIGVNLVSSIGLSVLHAEVVATMMAQQRARSYTLNAPDMPRHELFTSCEPCAMCLGAVLWSGVRRLVCGATKADAEAIGFDEGPVYDASYDYLAERGIEVVRGVQRAAARSVLTDYAAGAGVIYNG
jgi:tRNA(Arg) A34 adenosine deaminase TadA